MLFKKSIFGIDATFKIANYRDLKSVMVVLIPVEFFCCCVRLLPVTCCKVRLKYEDFFGWLEREILDVKFWSYAFGENIFFGKLKCSKSLNLNRFKVEQKLDYMFGNNKFFSILL